MTIAIIIGVISGVVASWIAWWVLFHIMGPDIRFSSQINKNATENTNTGHYYQFKFANLKKKSSAVDIVIQAKLYLKDFPREGVTNMYTIPTDGQNIFELCPKSEDDRGWGRRISLVVNRDEFTANLEKSFFTEELKKLARDKRL